MAYPLENSRYVVSGSSFQHGTLDTDPEPEPDSTLDDFESYADDADLESAWPSPGADYSYTIHTSSPIENTQSIETSATGSRITSSGITTSEGTEYSILLRMDTVAGEPGFYTHAQSTGSPFPDQVWARFDTDTNNVEVYVREGGSYNDSGVASLSESLSAGTVYRLHIVADASSGQATVTAYNHDTSTEIGSASCAYNTGYTGGHFGIYGDAESGTQFFDVAAEV